MSFQQLAKLCVRGSLFTKVMKGMPEKEMAEVNEIIIKLVKDPILRNCKLEFCAALRRTIRNEYSDPELGEPDYMIALVKATIAAKSDPEKDLSAILEDPIQKKKWYQTFVFNYLKQILTENKIPTYCDKTKIDISSEVIDELSNSLGINGISHNVINNSIFLKGDFKIDSIISSVEQKYLSDKVKIVVTTGKITVDAFRIVKERKSVKEHSLNNEESGEQVAARLKGKPMDDSETILKLKERLPSYAQSVLTIYLDDERPDEFINKYGHGKPRIIHISKFLGMSIKEVKRILHLIKVHFLILQLGY